VSQLLWTGAKRSPESLPPSIRCRAYDSPELRDRAADRATEERLRTWQRLLWLYTVLLALGWALLVVTACTLGRHF